MSSTSKKSSKASQKPSCDAADASGKTTIRMSDEKTNIPCVLPDTDAVAESFVSKPFEVDQSVCRKRLLTAETPAVAFEASNSNPRALNVSSMCSFAVGKLQTSGSGQQSLVLIPDCTFVCVDVRVKALEKNACASSSQNLAASANTGYFEAKKILSETFGTKKKKQEIRSSETNMIDFSSVQDDAHVIKEKIKEKIKKHSVAAEPVAEGAFDGGHGKPLPPYAIAAASPEAAFDWSAVAPDAAFADVSTDGDGCQVFSRMSDVPCLAATVASAASLDAPMLHSVVMLYSLVKFSMLIQRNRVITHQAESAIPHPSVFSFIAASYADRKSGDRLEISNFNQDYLVCAICLLYLRINGFEAKLNPLAKDMKVPTSKLVNYCRSFGCKIISSDSAGESTEESIKTAKLSTPLIFPSIKKGGRRT